MKTEKPWIVGDYSIRPITADRDTCTYCGQPRGAIHKEDCVIRQRTVVLKATIEYTVKVSEDWDQEMIEFHRNESSWCVDNMLGDIGRLEKAGNCLCGITKTEFVREATKEDEKSFKLFVDEMET